MKDILGREIQAGNYIAYGMRDGNSGKLKIYKVKEVLEDCLIVYTVYDRYTTQLVITSSGDLVEQRYTKWCYIGDKYQMIELTDTGKEKVKNKTSRITNEYAMFILDGFTPELFEREE